jgi:hypothetical protein
MFAKISAYYAENNKISKNKSVYFAFPEKLITFVET